MENQQDNQQSVTGPSSNPTSTKEDLEKEASETDLHSKSPVSPILELGHQSGQTTGAGSGSQSPPNVSSQQGGEGPSSVDPGMPLKVKCRQNCACSLDNIIEGQEDRISCLKVLLAKSSEGQVDAEVPPDMRAMSDDESEGLATIAAGDKSKNASSSQDDISCSVVKQLVNILKDVMTDGVHLKVEHCLKRVASLEKSVNNLRDTSVSQSKKEYCKQVSALESSVDHLRDIASGLQDQLKKSSEGLIGIGHSICSRLEADADVRARSGLVSTKVEALENAVNHLTEIASGLQVELKQLSEELIAIGHSICSRLPVDAEVRARSGLVSTSGTDDHRVDVVPGDGSSVANRDSVRATAEKPSKDSIFVFITMAYTAVDVLFTMYKERSHVVAVSIAFLAPILSTLYYIYGYRG